MKRRVFSACSRRTCEGMSTMRLRELWHLAEKALFLCFERASIANLPNIAGLQSGRALHAWLANGMPNPALRKRVAWDPRSKPFTHPRSPTGAPRLLPARPRHVRVARPHLDPNFAEGWASHGPTRDQGCLVCVTLFQKRLTRKKAVPGCE
jgi:hypothetical protein